KKEVGTEIVISLKENHDDVNYDDFLEEHTLKSIIKKYSDFIRYPIKMDVTEKQPQDDDSEELVDVTEEQTINSMVPIWRKNKQELKEEDYQAFYQEKHFGFDKPLS